MPCVPSESLAVVSEAADAIHKQVPSRVPCSELDLGDAIAVALPAAVALVERLLASVGLVPFDIVDEGHGAKERVEAGKDGAEPPWERVGSEPVVDIGELPVACESGVSGHTPGKSTPRICVAMGKGFS